MTARALMLQGTGSDVGKSVLTAALCRIARRRGLSVAPFKPQNMSNNAAACPTGGEIGRAQALQARAAGLDPHVDMNPVLLKPQTDCTAQLVVHGKATHAMEAADYMANRDQLMGAVMESFGRLTNAYDLVIVEGAGSPAEVNLRRGDIANMGFAEAAAVGVVLVAMLGVGVAEKSGLLSAAVRSLVLGAPPKLVTVAIVFAGIISNTASEVGYVVLIPLGGAIYYALGRHPLAGMAAAFAGVSGGYSANLLIGTIDPLLAGITEEAAQLIDPDYTVLATANWYFMVASTFLITAIGSLVSIYIVEPQLGKFDASKADPEILDEGMMQPLQSEEKKGLRWAGIAMLGVFALMAWVAGTLGLDALVSLAKLVGLNYLGCLLIIALIYGSMIKFLARLPVRDFFRGIVDAMAVSYSTASSNATLPVTLRCAERNLGVSNSVASFVISLGATINMNGTAMYLGLATLFGAQIFGVDLSMGDYFLISILATLGAVGAAGIPGAGLIMMALVFGAVGVPLETIAFVAGVDRIMDMMRTTTNVSGDAAVATTVAVMTGEIDTREMISADDV